MKKTVSVDRYAAISIQLSNEHSKIYEKTIVTSILQHRQYKKSTLGTELPG